MSEREEWRCEGREAYDDDTCGEWAPVDEWTETEVGCDDCGTHPAVVCPNCEAVFDLIYEDLPARPGTRSP